MPLKYKNGKLLALDGHLCLTCCQRYKCDRVTLGCSKTDDPLGPDVFGSLAECLDECKSDFCYLTASASGGIEGWEQTYTTDAFAATSGTIIVYLQHYWVPDHTKIYIDGVLVHDTGCVGGSWTLNFAVDAAPTHLLRMSINIDDCKNPGTAWNFNVSCTYNPAP